LRHQRETSGFHISPFLSAEAVPFYGNELPGGKKVASRCPSFEWTAMGPNEMHGEIITIGNELTSGRNVDLNAWYAAGRLTASGLQVTRITSVGDDYEMVAETLRRALESSRFVIVTGGLGSTEDDMTNEIVARALNRPLCLDEKMLRQIRIHAEDRGIRMTPSLEKMAWMPDGSRMLSPRGRACGFFLLERGIRLYFLPGIPDQMRYLMDTCVIPEITRGAKTLPIMRRRTLKIYGLSEPEIAEIFKSLKGTKPEKVLLGFYPHFPENHITLSIRGDSEGEAEEQLNKTEERIREIAGDYIFGTEGEEMEQVVGKALLAKGLSISVAESLTGGLIGHMLTNVAGSSGYFEGGVLAYSNQSKIDLLQVRPGTLRKDGAVSDSTAREMARGIRVLMKSDLGLSVTGIAGPAGGSKKKPVGTVHVGLASEDRVFARKYRFWGNRTHVKLNSAMMALDWVRRYLHEDPFFSGF
jgi:nicotinamide-nucleotide amidase